MRVHTVLELAHWITEVVDQDLQSASVDVGCVTLTLSTTPEPDCYRWVIERRGCTVDRGDAIITRSWEIVEPIIEQLENLLVITIEELH